MFEKYFSTLGIKNPFKQKYDNFIGGTWVAPVEGQYFDNISPINGKVFCKVARSSAKNYLSSMIISIN